MKLSCHIVLRVVLAFIMSYSDSLWYYSCKLVAGPRGGAVGAAAEERN